MTDNEASTKLNNCGGEEVEISVMGGATIYGRRGTVQGGVMTIGGASCKVAEITFIRLSRRLEQSRPELGLS